MSNSQESGRLVLNHSSHVAGLLEVLYRLVEQPGIKTVTPGRINRVRGRPTPLKIKVTVPTIGGHKLLARSKGSVQEIFVVTDLSAKALQQAVNSLVDTKS